MGGAGIEEIGIEIEEPFGILPLEVFSAMSIKDLTALINNLAATDHVANIDFEYPDDSPVFRHQ